MDYSANPAIRNRLVDSALDQNTIKKNGLAQRISNLIAATMVAGTGFGTGAPPDPGNITCRLYIVKDTQMSAHLEVTYKDPKSGAVKPFEKYGSHHNLIGGIADGEIKFAPRFIDDLPLTPEQKQYLESVLKNFI